jgi:hypothetical protein
MSGRLSVAGSIVCVAAIVVAIVAGYGRLSQTIDEPTHIAAGLEWLQDGRITFRTENPPIARVIVALGPYLAGIRLPSSPHARWHALAGSRFLYQGPGYITTLSRARLGTLLFLVLSAVVVWLWVGGTYQPSAAALAVAMFVTIPSIVAHAGLATTDIAFIAVCLVAGLAIQRWIERPTWPRAVGVGVAVGISVATKFSTFVFLPPIALALIVTWWFAALRRAPDSPIRWSRTAWQSGMVMLIAMFVVWASYRFSVGRLSELPQQFGIYGHYPRTGLAARMKDVPIPAPGFWHGLLFLRAYEQRGQMAYLFGETRRFGFWYFHPVALAVKTPLPFLVFAAIGLGLLWRDRRSIRTWTARAAAIGAGGVLAASLASPLDTGLRHVMVVYPLIAIAAAAGFASVQSESARRRARIVAIVLVAWQAGVLARTWPYQLAYFNELAGKDPGSILNGSDLDWGQDFFALVRYCRTHHVDELSIAYEGTLDQCAHGLPPLRPLDPYTPTTGWIAISDIYWRHITASALRRDPCNPGSVYGATTMRPEWFQWLHHFEPVAVAGRSIRIYHIVDATTRR